MTASALRQEHYNQISSKKLGGQHRGRYEMMACEASYVKRAVPLLIQVLHVDAETEERPHLVDKVLI